MIFKNRKIRQPVIIGLADATSYLVGTMDQEGNFRSLADKKNKTTFPGLEQAKSHLRKLKYKDISVRFYSAYDEMCGLSGGKF